MRCSKKILLDLSPFFIIQCDIFIGILETCMIHNVSLAIAVNYFIFQLLFMFIQGYAFLIILNKRQVNLLSTTVLSYSLGLFLLVVEYLVTMLSGVPAWIIGIIAIVCSIFAILKKGWNILEFNIGKESLVGIIVIYSTMCIFCLFLVSARKTLPIENECTNTYKEDFLYWISNTISLSKSFPPKDIRLYNDNCNYYYHYFSSIIVAQSSKITNISIQLNSLYFSYIVPLFMLVLGSMYFVEQIIKNSFLKYVAVVGFLFTEGTSITYTYHLYYNPFGFDYGFFFGIICMGWLMHMIRINDKSIVSQVIAGILIGMTTGCKGPVAMVVLIGYGVYTLYLFCKKEFKVGIIGGVIYLMSFLGIYFIFIGGLTHSTGPGGLEFLEISDVWDNNPWAQNIYKEYSWICKDESIGKLLSILIYVLNVNRAMFYGIVIGICGLIYKLVKKENKKMYGIILITVSIGGILLTLFTHQEGNSQMYFVMSVVPYGVCLGICVIDELIENTNILIANVLVIIQLIGIVAGLYIFCYGSGGKVYIEPQLYGQVIEKIKYGVCALATGNEDEEKDKLTLEEYNTYNWIKENTENDAVFAIDKSCLEEPNYQELIAFGEKYVWNDGMYDRTGEIEIRNELLEQILGSSQINELLREQGISYILVPTNSSYINNINTQCKQIYFNSTYSVYKAIKINGL